MRAAATVAVSLALVLASTLASRAAEPRVLVIGDSLSAGYGARAPDRGWPSLLGVPIAGEAAPGMTSSFFVGRSWRAEIAVVELGINDCRDGVPPVVFALQMREILLSVSARRIVLIVPYETGGERGSGWRPYAQSLVDLARGDPRVALVDLRPAFGAPTTRLLAPDLIHPNDAGHALIAQLVATALRT